MCTKTEFPAKQAANKPWMHIKTRCRQKLFLGAQRSDPQQKWMYTETGCTQNWVQTERG